MPIYPYQEDLIRRSVRDAAIALEGAKFRLAGGMQTNDVEWLLQDLSNAQRRAAAAMAQGVTLARAAGFTWNEIGENLGVSRQAAQQRYGNA